MALASTITIGVWVLGFESPEPTPVTDVTQPPFYTSIPFNLGIGASGVSGSMAHNWGSVMPNLDLPKLDGSNLKIWQKHCETFFEFYSVPPEL